MKIKFSRTPAITKAAVTAVVVTAALTASAGVAHASTDELCIGSTCYPYGSVPTGYPLTIPYNDGSTPYVLQVTKNKYLAPKGWTAASIAPFGEFGTPEPTTAATSISIPQFDAAGQATCIDFTYTINGTTYGIFISSTPTEPGTWEQNPAGLQCYR
jgi:hypothetical protein